MPATAPARFFGPCMQDASSCTTPSALGRPLQPTPVWFGSSSTMETPATSASSTSAPPVIILNALATQVTPSASLDRLPFPDATTHGLTLFGVIIVGACPKRGFAAAAAATPAAAVDRTKSRRFGFFMSTSFADYHTPCCKRAPSSTTVIACSAG